MPHPDEGLIHAWLDGELDAGEAARVEALVASDPEWAATAAEARGLLAASTRIVGSLDRVPANVIPKPAAAQRSAIVGRPWLLRAAAILVLIGGSAVVLNRASIDGGDITIPLKQPAAAPVTPSAPTPAATPAPATAKVSAKPSTAQPLERAPGIASKSNIIKKELDEQKQKSALADKDRNAPAESRIDAATSGAGANTADMAAARRAAAAPATVAPAAPAPLQQGADSIRLEKFTQRGDTLAAVNGRLKAVRAPCPAP